MNRYIKKMVILMTIPIVLACAEIYKGFREHQQINSIRQSIQEGKLCVESDKTLECAYEQLAGLKNMKIDPLSAQSFFSEICMKQMEKFPDQKRQYKDQYFIFTANFYSRSLKQHQKTIISRIPFLKHENVDIHIAKLFLKSMEEYGNRREVDRAIASETILQEVSNFNAALQELTSLIASFQ